MKIIVRGVIDWATCKVLEEESFEYCGPLARCKSSGSAPQPTDPYEQAAAQYGLSTGTANYNAALDRTNSVNPLGSNTWSVTGQDGNGTSNFGGYPTGFGDQNETSGGYYGMGGTGTPAPGSAPAAGMPGSYVAPFGLGGSSNVGPLSQAGAPGQPAATASPYGLGGGAMNGGSGAPLYTQQTSLQPWANQLISSPIDTSGIPGMPGGPSEQQNVNSAENATFNQQMSLLQPQEALQSEQTQAQLEAEGAMPGSAAFNTGEMELGQTQGVENSQVANSAVTSGMNELPMLYGLGSTSLQNQLAERSAPISEYEALQGGPSANVSASTPDISGAFGQQYSGALAGYNANVATNNADTSGLASLAAAAAIYF
jgi:hypothetical protein